MKRTVRNLLRFGHDVVHYRRQQHVKEEAYSVVFSPYCPICVYARTSLFTKYLLSNRRSYYILNIISDQHLDIFLVNNIKYKSNFSLNDLLCVYEVVRIQMKHPLIDLKLPI